MTDFKTRSDKKKVFDAMAAASIYSNSAGVDTSRARVIPIDSFVHFLEHFQKEGFSEEEAAKMVEVSYSGTNLLLPPLLWPSHLEKNLDL